MTATWTWATKSIRSPKIKQSAYGILFYNSDSIAQKYRKMGAFNNGPELFEFQHGERKEKVKPCLA